MFTIGNHRTEPTVFQLKNNNFLKSSQLASILLNNTPGQWRQTQLTMKTEYTLDFRGSITPIMLLKMTQMFSKMNVEDVLEIRGSNPDTQADLFRVLPKASYELLSVDTSGNKDMEYFYRIRLKKCETK